MLEIIEKINEIAIEYAGILSIIGVTVFSIITGTIKYVIKNRKIKEEQIKIKQKEIETKRHKFENYKSITIKLIEEFLDSGHDHYADWKYLVDKNSYIEHYIKEVLGKYDDIEDIQNLLIHLEIIECYRGSNCKFVLPMKPTNDRNVYFLFLKYLEALINRVENNEYDDKIMEYIKNN